MTQRDPVTIPSNGSSLFQSDLTGCPLIGQSWKVTIPSNGSSLFQYKEKWKIAEFLTSMVTIPSNGSSLFQSTDTTETTVFFWLGVTIPSNGSSLFQQMVAYLPVKFLEGSQSPQTGQVYFNFLSTISYDSRKSNASQSPQTGQVYFNIFIQQNKRTSRRFVSQSPQTGQVYFNTSLSSLLGIFALNVVTIPSNGSSLFQFTMLENMQEDTMEKSQSPQTGQVYFNKIMAS